MDQQARVASAPALNTKRHLGLDGLRGLAVVWVVCFHLWPDLLPGGWLGVSLFFTLSGYLVVGLVDREITTSGRLHLARFMARRVRRLMPAALATIVLVLAMTAVLDDQAMREIGLDALAAVLNVFNWRSAADSGGYAAIFDASPEPLAHFWSLAIEEQFYLVVPAAVAFTRRPVTVVTAMVLVGVAGIVLWWGSPDAYVATPTRALEIAAGALLVIGARRSTVLGRFAGSSPLGDRGSAAGRRTSIGYGFATGVSIVMVVVALMSLGPVDPLVFRGGPQVMALCWVVLIAAAVRPGVVSSLLSTRVLCWLGTRSYAIYLFHWPLAELTDWSAPLVIAVTLAAAEASYHLIEMPIRVRSGAGDIKLLLTAAPIVAVVCVAVVAGSSPARGVGEQRQGAAQLPEWAIAASDAGSASTTTTAQLDAGDPTLALSTPPRSSDSFDSLSSTVEAVPETPQVAGAGFDDANTTIDSEVEGATSGADSDSRAASSGEHDVTPESAHALTEGSKANELEAAGSDALGSVVVEEPAGRTSTGREETSPRVGSDPEVAAPQTGRVNNTSPSTSTNATTEAPAVTVVPIVTVLGDSTGVHIADGLRRWADANQIMAVVDHTRVGCSPAMTPARSWRIVSATPNEDWGSWMIHDHACRDDVIFEGSAAILVVDHGSVQFEHRRPDGSWASLLDDDLYADITDSYRSLIDRAASLNATVVFTAAAPLLAFYGQGEPIAAERARAYNTLIQELVDQEQSQSGNRNVAVIDFASHLDDSGYEGRYGRSDGMHVDFDRAELLASEVLGPALLQVLEP